MAREATKASAAADAAAKAASRTKSIRNQYFNILFQKTEDAKKNAARLKSAVASGQVTKRQAIRSKSLQLIILNKFGFGRLRTLAYGSDGTKGLIAGLQKPTPFRRLNEVARQATIAKSGGVKAVGDRYAKAWATRVAKYGPAGGRVGLRKR